MKLSFITLLTASLLSCSLFQPSYTPTAGQIIEGKASYVIDGDTFYFSFDHGKFKTRLADVRAPRIDEKYGSECYEFLRELIHQKNIRIEYLESDQEGRWIVHTHLTTGENVGEKVQAYMATLSALK